MLTKILVIVLLGVCSAHLFEDGLKKLSPGFQNAVKHFAVKFPKEVEKATGIDVKSKSQVLLDRLRSSVLLKGTPLGSFHPQQLLPLFGLQQPSEQKPVDQKPQHPLKLTTYKVVNCSNFNVEKAKIIIKQLDITPDPVVMPGTLNFAFNVQMLQDIEDLEINLELRFKEEDTYITVPCIGGYGSCPYDVCQMLKPVDPCPSQLVAHNIPCHCPYNKGTYAASGISAEIDASVFVTGDYNATATMKSGGQEVGCYTALFTISG